MDNAIQTMLVREGPWGVLVVAVGLFLWRLAWPTFVRWTDELIAHFKASSIERNRLIAQQGETLMKLIDVAAQHELDEQNRHARIRETVVNSEQRIIDAVSKTRHTLVPHLVRTQELVLAHAKGEDVVALALQDHADYDSDEDMKPTNVRGR